MSVEFQQSHVRAIAATTDGALARNLESVAAGLPGRLGQDSRRRLVDGLDFALATLAAPAVAGWYVAGPENITFDAFASLVHAFGSRRSGSYKVLRSAWRLDQTMTLDALVAHLLERGEQHGLWPLEDSLGTVSD